MAIRIGTPIDTPIGTLLAGATGTAHPSGEGRDSSNELICRRFTGPVHGKTTLQLRLNLPTFRTVNDSQQPCPADACQQAELCPLASVKAGTAVRIKRLTMAPEVSHRLREMGFCEEQQVHVVSKHVNVICQVCHARLGLSQQLAEAILVQPLPKNLKLDVA